MGIRRKKSLIDQAGEFAENLLPTIESAMETAREKAGPVIAEGKSLAREKAGPVIAEGRTLAREKAMPALANGAATVKERASEKVAELRAEPAEPEPVRKPRRLLRLLMFVGLLATAGAVARKLTASDSDWQSSYTPPPPPPPPTTQATAAGATTAVDDVAGASPDEALADATEEPHPVTTPDQPAEVVDLKPESTDKA